MRLVDTIKVIDSWVLSAGKKPVTVIKLAKDAPNTDWNNIAVENDLLEMVYMSGGNLDTWAVSGSYDLVGKEVSFI